MELGKRGGGGGGRDGDRGSGGGKLERGNWVLKSKMKYQQDSATTATTFFQQASECKAEDNVLICGHMCSCTGGKIREKGRQEKTRGRGLLKKYRETNKTSTSIRIAEAKLQQKK